MLPCLRAAVLALWRMTYQPPHRIAAAAPRNISVTRHFPLLVIHIRIGRAFIQPLHGELILIPADQHLFVRCAVDPLVGCLATQGRSSALRPTRSAGSRPCSPNRKFRRTYFTPDSTLPLICTWYGRHSRGVKRQSTAPPPHRSTTTADANRSGPRSKHYENPERPHCNLRSAEKGIELGEIDCSWAVIPVLRPSGWEDIRRRARTKTPGERVLAFDRGRR